MSLFNITRVFCRLHVILFVMSILAMSSCERDGEWDAIELNRDHVSFSSEGGQSIVTILNYGGWWISGGYSIVVDDQPNPSDYINATSSEGANGLSDTLDGGWYRALIPEKGRSNTVVIIVYPNEGAPRRTFIQMSVGNAFARIDITQE